MKKILLIISILLLTGCDTESNEQAITENHNGKCLEYTTEYRLDCGLFTCSDTFCCERKYNKCIRWDE